MARPVSLTKLQTGDANLDRVQEHLRQQLLPVLANPALGSADFRWIEVAGSDKTQPGTWALQFRSAGTTWNTVLTVDSKGGVITTATTSSLAQPAWIAPTLLNSYTAPRPVGYFKDSLGIVHLRGTVTGGLADTIFTLPAGYRPAQLWIFSTDHNGAFGRVLVNTNGDVQSDLGLHTNVVLDGIVFDTRS